MRFMKVSGSFYTLFQPYKKQWDVDLESSDLDISLAALNIGEPSSVVGYSSSTHQSTIGRAPCSIFQEYEDGSKDDDY